MRTSFALNQPTEDHSHKRPASYNAKFQMYLDMKILLNCLSEGKPHLSFKASY